MTQDFVDEISEWYVSCGRWRAEPLGAAKAGAARREAWPSPAPDQPDPAWVDHWLHRSYLDYWASRS
ncbi:MAG: hypothetical protein J2P35_17975 [Actinobacteria bacterium]|nr:hypothetical protein [Actinomycetota bacterium]